jgi:DNA repair protein SbcD/Mre11
MRLIHTADWHLGRLFHNVHLTADQEVVLLQLVELVAQVKPHAVLVAGDLYDRGVPPPEAVALLDHVLSEIVLGLGVPVIAIAGNHDSPKRIAFGSRVLRERGLYLAGELGATPPVVELADEHGPVFVHLLPFADAAEARAVYRDDDIHDQQAVLQAGVRRALAGAGAGRHVALAHAFVAGGLQTPDSERPISVGGATQVPAAVFDGFDYVALGHLHRPQHVQAPHLRYAGSLLKYSFAEYDHHKSVSVIEMGAPGSAARLADAAGDAGSEHQAAAPGQAAVRIETVDLAPLHDVRRLSGTLEELLQAGAADPRRDDYVHAALLDRGALLDPIGRLRAVYPNTLAIERPLYEATGSGAQAPRPGHVGDDELFDAFFDYATGEHLDDAQTEALRVVLGTLERRRREAS